MMNTATDLGFGVYAIYAVATLAVLSVSLAVRIHNRATVEELVRTRGYELPPFRWVIHTVHVAIWLTCLVAAVTAMRYVVALFDGFQAEYAWTAFGAVTLAIATGFLGYLTLGGLVLLDHNDPPRVEVATVATHMGIEGEHLGMLGVEQFPECLAYDETADLKWRFGLLGGGATVVALRIAAASEWGREHGLYDLGNRIVDWFGSLIPALPPQPAFVLGVSAALALLMLVVFNGTYTLMPFSTTLKVGAGTAAVALWSAGSLGGRAEDVGTAAIVVWLAFSARWGHDLVRAFRFKNVRGVARPIANGVARAIPFLEDLRDRSDCRLEVLDERALCTRITRGCRNVEEASPLVTRNLARFLSLVRIEHEHFAAATLRYLTVRRYLTSVGGGGTLRPLQDPEVPIWNEFLFPLYPPQGFRDWLDPLGLGAQWDRVCTCHSCHGSGQVSCGGCGGSGRQTRPETYTEYSGGKTATRTRYVTVTCSTCSGSGRVTCSPCSGMGRLVYHRTLNTQWQRLFATCTAPHVDVPELMEEAEERTYFRVPLVENRICLPIRPEHDGIDPDLETRLAEAVDSMGSALPRFARSVEELHDGLLYRSDFQVTGFYVLRILFERLRGRVGWFFGRRPEFYFPRLPLGWSMVCTILFVLPFLALTAALLVGVANQLLSSLPPIY